MWNIGFGIGDEWTNHVFMENENKCANRGWKLNLLPTTVDYSGTWSKFEEKKKILKRHAFQPVSKLGLGQNFWPAAAVGMYSRVNTIVWTRDTGREKSAVPWRGRRIYVEEKESGQVTGAVSDGGCLSLTQRDVWAGWLLGTAPIPFASANVNGDRAALAADVASSRCQKRETISRLILDRLQSPCDEFSRLSARRS